MVVAPTLLSTLTGDTLMITLAIAGKPNCGKSTFFKAATLAQAEIASYRSQPSMPTTASRM